MEHRRTQQNLGFRIQETKVTFRSVLKALAVSIDLGTDSGMFHNLTEQQLNLFIFVCQFL